MKKNLIFILLLFFCLASSFAQAPVDIFDPFYEDLAVWENIGLINYAPRVRPFPLQEIKRILEIVMNVGDAGQRKTATEYHNRFFGKAFRFGGEFGIALRYPAKSRLLSMAPLMDINYMANDLFSMSGVFSVYLTNKIPEDEPLPIFQYSKRDIAEDSVGTKKLFILPMINTGIAIGNPKYYFTAAIARTTYTPFPESGIFVGPQAPHQGQFNLVFNLEKFSFSQSLLALNATNDFGKSQGPGKFLSIHTVDYRPLSWLSFGMVDAVVYGGRFDPIYCIPFSVFFVSQGLYDFPDNSLIGANFTIKPIEGLRFDGALYADDIGFNEIIKFKKNAKMRMSGQFGVSYTMPKTHWFNMVDFHYTFVAPYCYTHIGDDYDPSAPNHFNCTHVTVPLCSNLDPNSDRFFIRLKFKPVHGLTLSLTNTFIRHANISESISDGQILLSYLTKEYNTDGSTLNHPTVENNISGSREHAFLYSTPFLSQDTIEYINQLEFEITAHLPILRSGGHMSFSLSYLFEADINPGVRKSIYSPAFDPDTEKVFFENLYSNLPDPEKKKVRETAKAQLDSWKASARGKAFNHYIKFGAKFSY